MSITKKVVDNVIILTLENKYLDQNLSEELRGILLDGIKNNLVKVIIDMANIRHIRSVGLGLIISALKTLETKGGKLKICNLDTRGKELFKLCKLEKRVEIHDSEKNALENFGNAKQ